MFDQYDYVASYNVLRSSLADRDTCTDDIVVVSVPGGRSWALKRETPEGAKKLALQLLRHPRIDQGITPLDLMGGVYNYDFPYFSQTHEPLLAIAIAIKEGYIRLNPIINRYVARTDNPFVKEYIEDMQERRVVE